MAHTTTSYKHTDLTEDAEGRLFVPANALGGPAAAESDSGPSVAPSRPAAPTPHGEPSQRHRRPERTQPASAYDALLASIMRSKSQPMIAAPPGARDDPPWTTAARARSGAHKWLLAPDRWPSGPAGRRVVVLDRRGSYPAAMSGVHVAATALAHRGPIPRQIRGMAGLYLIHPPTWEEWDFPPPLGHLVAPLEDGRVWVTDPHLELLTKRLNLDVEITDSWLGPHSASLFRRFSEWARDYRNEVRGTDTEIRRKVAINTAIQMIHSSVPSGIWRPDWLAAIHAEARCRHWAKAWQARNKGMTVVGLTKEDEVAVLAPPDAKIPYRDDEGRAWVGSYEVGTGYGHVSIKGVADADDWLEEYERVAR